MPSMKIRSRVKPGSACMICKKQKKKCAGSNVCKKRNRLSDLTPPFLDSEERFVKTSSEYPLLHTEHPTLHTEHPSLHTEHPSLHTEHLSLHTEHSSLQSDLDTAYEWQNLFEPYSSEIQLFEDGIFDTAYEWQNPFGPYSSGIQLFDSISQLTDYLESAEGLDTSLQQSSPSALSSQSIGSTDSSPNHFSNYSTPSLPSSLKCDRCSVKKIRCSHSIPCEKCIADGVDCSVSVSRRHHPGTCQECVRRKIPCVGSDAICFGCKFLGTPHLCRPVPRSSTY